MDTNSSLRQLLILSLTTDAGDLNSAYAKWACVPSAPDLTLACVFRIPSSHSCQTSHPYWEIWIHNSALCLPTSRKSLPDGALQKPQMKNQRASTSTAPKLDKRPLALMLCLTQPEARHLDRQGYSWPHTQHIGHAVALGHHLFPT